MRRALRLLAVGWLLHMKMLSRSSFNSLLGILYPLFFATVAFFMFRAGSDGKPLLYASLGAAVMGIWSSTSTSAGNALSRERWHGTLELLVAAPAHFSLVILPITIAMAAVGIYSMAATLLWGRLVFGIGLRFEHPLAFVVAVPATVLSIGALGFLFSVLFVRFRQAWALGNMFEYPVWLVCGFLVPLSLFPSWVRPISWVLAPTWGIEAIRRAALGGSAWGDIGLALGLGAAYTLLGVLVVHRLLDAARRKATLSLT
jgi:ABC-2 type transport system permease protein